MSAGDPAEVVSKRYEAHKPIILTSNKTYGTWDASPMLAKIGEHCLY